MLAQLHKLAFPALTVSVASTLLYLDKLSSAGWCVALLLATVGYYLPDVLGSRR
jgi:hypothetical protein